MKVVVINDSLTDFHKDYIKKTAARIGADLCFAVSEKDVPADYADAEVVYGYGLDMAKTSKSLKWLSVPSAGVDYLLKPSLFANEDCIITNSSGSYGVSIAEHIIAVSLMMMRKLTYAYQCSLRGEWGSHQLQRSLKGSRITVLGTGDIGRCFAVRARAFEPEALIGVSRSGRCEEPVFDCVKKTDELDGLLSRTDLLVMCLPDTPETRNILSRERISLFREGAYVVNVGRGSAIDEDALADSLDEGKLGGAALDVFAAEPLPRNSRLWSTKNILITPHVAGNLTLEHTVNKNVEMFCENLLRYANGKPLKHMIDRNKGY